VSSTGDEAALAALARLDRITRRLRRECPWDREQDERSIVPHTVEESYELADAAGRGDDEKLVDELGDVLFQVHFLSLLLEERGAGDLADVADAITAKLIRRHPHVFGADSGESAALVADTAPASASDVLTNWDRIKTEVEGRGGDEPFADVPENLPGPLYARKILRRAASAGLEGPADAPEQALESARASLRGLAAAVEEGASADPSAPVGERDRVERDLGELLLAAVDAARILRADPELALRAAADRVREQGRG
jgi:MazG family protein